MVNQNQAQNQKQKQKRTPVCVYWDGDKGGYTIYLARYIRGVGWVEDLYLGFARNLNELIRIMSIFNYVKVCGNDAMRRRDVDATRQRDVGCDAVSQMVGAC